MHTFTGKNGSVINYNSDLSGVTYIELDGEEVILSSKQTADLKEFFNETLVKELINKLEAL